MKKNINILIAGTGAIGGYYGGRLLQNQNNNVCFLARGKNLDNLKKNGLKIKSIDGNLFLKINVSDDPEEFKIKFDLIIISVKSYDTEELINQIKNVVHKYSLIFTLQNGIDNYNKLGKAFGKKRILQGICRIGVEMTDKSVIHHTALGFIVSGEENKKISPRINNLKNIFTACNVHFKISEDIIKDMWVKYGWNCIFNTLTGICVVTTDKFFESPEAEAVVQQFYLEFKKIAKSQGINLNAKDKIKIIDDTKKFSFRTSTFQDRLKNKKLEYETFTGYLMLLAEKQHLNIPLIKILHNLIRTVEKKVSKINQLYNLC